MNTTTRRQFAAVLLLSLFATTIQAQELRAFNQNASGSNHTRLSFAFSPVYSMPVNSQKDSLLFRGNGAGFRFGADYFFGKAGISFSSGFGTSGPDDASINNFLRQSSLPLDLLTITKARQQNMYLLVGPSVRTGGQVELYAHAKAGMFINNSGLVNIQQKGAQRPLYRNESTNKSIYPGFLAGMNMQYKGKSDAWSFGIGLDYMGTKSEVNNYDARRGGGIEALKLSRNISDLVAGITIRYNILSPRDHASGQSTGRLLPTVNKREIAMAREASSGMATGRRLLPTVNKRELVSPRDQSSGLPTGRMNQSDMLNGSDESCGAVVQRITNPDGSTEEMTFACPNDAASYNRALQTGDMPSRISTNMTVGKQTQGATFGEKVNAGLHAAGGALASGASRSIISGKLTRVATDEATGIINNKTISGPIRSGSTTLNSQTSSTRQTQNTSFGSMVRLSARDVSTGMATGKRSRDVSTGMATGRRQYEPVFTDNSGEICNPCVATVSRSFEGVNPLYGSKSDLRTTGTNENCSGVAGVDVSLIDINTSAVISTTKTEACGDFFFANVPSGSYIVKLSAELLTKKRYDISLKSKTDLLGEIEEGNGSLQLLINSDQGSDMEQRAGISTSRSNIRSKSIAIIEADLDGDGEFESLSATATFPDGTSADITADVKRGTGTAGITLQGNALQMSPHRVEVLKSNKQGDPKAKSIALINLSHNGNKVAGLATFSDGSIQDITETISSNTEHGNVRQYDITIADMDGDGVAEASINTTRSNIKHQKIAAGDTDGDGIWSPRSNIRKMIPVTMNEASGGERTGMTAGNQLRTEFAVLRQRQKGYFENGDIPTSQQRPGAPIKGVIVKGGRNPSPDIQSRTSNENGQFEFTDLEAGDYTFTIEQPLLLNDETIIQVSDDSPAENINTSEDNLKGNTKISTTQNTPTLRAQNNNTVRSNRSELKSILIEADLDGDGDYESDVTSKVNDELVLNENGQPEAPVMKAGVSTSRSNIRNRSSFQSMGNELYISLGTALVNNKEVPVRCILKTRHDTVKNSINNVR